MRALKASLFGTSGIRGVVPADLTPELCREVGQAVGTTLPVGSKVCIATDTRLSREVLKSAVTAGLLSCGADVSDWGILPTPALAFLTQEMGFDTGVMLTASHNPPEFNGIKLFNKSSMGYSKVQEAEIERIYGEKMFRDGYLGSLNRRQGIRERYLQFMLDRFSSRRFERGLRVVVDPGNGAASGFASDILFRIGFQAFPVNDEPDGLFRGRNPEPREDTLQGTVEFLRRQNADLAICFDGDADRVVFCDREGFLGFNEMVAFISRLAVRETGKKSIATTVETGRLLDLALQDLGVEVVRGKVGDVNVAYLAQELDAALGVEQVGVYVIPEAGYYPDSFFAALTLLSQIRSTSEIRDFFARMPRLYFKTGRVSCPNQFKETVMGEIEGRATSFGAGHINTLDGIRLEFDHSWMLLRASGTEPVIRVLAEATSEPKAQVLLNNGIQAVQKFVRRVAQ